jgi:hypothetical protein
MIASISDIRQEEIPEEEENMEEEEEPKDDNSKEDVPVKEDYDIKCDVQRLQKSLQKRLRISDTTIILLLSKRNQLKRYLWIQWSSHVYIVPLSMALWPVGLAVCIGYHTAKDCTKEEG